MVTYDYRLVQVYGCAHCSHKEMYDIQMQNHIKNEHGISKPIFNLVEEEK